MVNITAKTNTLRIAIAQAVVNVSKQETIDAINNKNDIEIALDNDFYDKNLKEIKKKTKRMVFLECYLECKGKIIASATGIWKILQRKLTHAGLS